MKAQESVYWQKLILRGEEHLVEALCFDFVVRHPHWYLTKLFSTVGHEDRKEMERIEDMAWTIACDSYYSSSP
jgi:hypothetical protein